MSVRPSGGRVATASIAVVVSALGLAGAQAARQAVPFMVFSSNFTPELRATDIFVMDRNGSGRRDLTRSPAIDERLVAVSPTKEEAAFVRTEATIVDKTSLIEESLWVVSLDRGSARRLWTSPPLEPRYEEPNIADVAWSPDGRFIAFDGRTSPEQHALHVAPVAGGIPVVLNGQGRSVWLPDSSRLIFGHGDGRLGAGLAIVRPDGTDEQALTKPGPEAADVDPAVSPDGRRVAFRRLDPGPPSATPALVVVERATQTEHVLLPRSGKGCGEYGGCEGLTWSPAGDRIAFLRHINGVEDYAEVLDAGGAAAPRGVDDDDHNAKELRWSPSGKRLAVIGRFTSLVDPRAGENPVRVNGGNFVWLAEDGYAYTTRNRIVLSKATGRTRELAYRRVSPDSFASLAVSARGRLVFASEVARNDSEVVVWRNGTRSALTHDEVDDWSPTIAPDGSLIAFLRGGQPWLMRPDGSHARRVSTARGWWLFWWPDGASLVLWSPYRRPLMIGLDGFRWQFPAGEPAWSADGTIVASLEKGVLSLGRPGGRLARFATGVGSFDLAPDGAAVAYDRRGTLYLADVARGRRRLLARNAEGPVWSPDGRWLAFQHHRQKWSLLVARSNGTHARNLGPGGRPVWSPDSRTLAWFPGTWDSLKVAGPDGSGSRTIERPPSRTFDQLAWAPDSRRLVLWDEVDAADAVSGDPSQLYLIDVARGTLDRLSPVYANEGPPDWGPACTITGSGGGDRLVGTPQRDVICALGGDDVVLGRGGDDLIYGGDGNDKVDGGAGNDILFGGLGADKLLARDGASDGVNGGPGRDRAAADPVDRLGFLP